MARPQTALSLVRLANMEKKMKLLSSIALGLGATLGSLSTAWAGAGEVTTVVTPLSTNVSFTESASDPFFIVYAVRVANEVGNTINNIVFTGATAPVPTTSGALATFDSATGATCTTTNAERTAISCSIGQLKAGGSAVFYVTFVAPTAAAGSTDTTFSGTTYYAEGTGGLENSIPQNSTRAWAADIVALGTTSPSNIKTGVPQVNKTLKFSTAPNSVDAELSDQITMTVSVPGTTPITSTLTILDEPLSPTDPDCVAQGNFYRCYTSTLTIPDFVYPSGSGKYLGITLRIDPAAIKPGFKPGNVRVYYDSSLVPACQVTSPSSTPITYAALPCYTGIVYYKNWNRNSSWPQAWEGSVDVFAVHDRNGRWGIE
jgi:hypothetical protein